MLQQSGRRDRHRSRPDAAGDRRERPGLQRVKPPGGKRYRIAERFHSELRSACSRHLLERISNRWVLMLGGLGVGVGPICRARRAADDGQVEDLSCAGLGQRIGADADLRRLERDGLLTRSQARAAPVGVVCELTDPEWSLQHVTRGLAWWVQSPPTEVCRWMIAPDGRPRSPDLHRGGSNNAWTVSIAWEARGYPR